MSGIGRCMSGNKRHGDIWRPHAGDGEWRLLASTSVNCVVQAGADALVEHLQFVKYYQG
jgi:hypothetical protein